MDEIAASQIRMAKVCRVVGWLLMFCSILMIADPLVGLIRFIPFVGPVFAKLLGITIFLVALVGTLLLSAVIIAVAYVLVRPLLTIGLAAAMGVILLLGNMWLQSSDSSVHVFL